MTLKLKGSSSGYVALDAPATAGDNTLTLPANNGSANQLLKTDGSGNLSWTNDNSGVSLSGSTNNTICTVTGANAIQGEGYLTFDGSHLTQTIDTDGQGFNQIASGNYYIDNIWDSNRSSAGSAIGRITGKWNGTEVASIKFVAGTDTTNKDDAHITFWTSAANNNAERMRIQTDGKILIGTTTPQQNANADDLVVSTSGTTGITIRSGTSSNGNLFFADGTSSGAEYAGWVTYDHNNNRLTFGTNTAERVVIDSNGSVHIDGSTSANHGLRFTPGGWNGYDNRMGFCGTSGADFWWSSNWNPTDGARDHSGYATNYIRQNVNTGYISFGTGPADSSALERLKIDNSAIYVKSGFPLAFLASSGATPNMKSGGTNAQDLLFTTGSGNPTRLQIGGGGDVTVNTGNLVIGTAGKGIDFSSTGGPGQGTDTSELFDDYEEGTFSPIVLNGWGVTSATYSINSGFYTKIGNLVYVIFHLKLSGGSVNGNMLSLYNFPYTPKDTSDAHAAINGYCDVASGNATDLFIGAGNNGTTIFGVKRRTSTGIVAWTGTDGGSSMELNFSGCYLV